ncbi:bifunctional diaminohydroxyphosphoribosylaminopyrimidine deaminase/5-amino-6-(5-phosphoribosylamino)uracil reductase RibD [Thermodesulfobacteriota bacterium B35]
MCRDDTEYMRLALAEAAKGLGRTSPNPCVGAVIVRDNVVVGRGYHRRAGTPHAEVNAIADAGSSACRGATIYVTLEPCNHSGRTPPCTRAILAAGIRRVVVGMKDPNPSVAGGGMEFLAAQGIEVTGGVLAEECRRLNFPFLKHVTSGLPWVVMKAGMSLDGRISYRQGAGGVITGAASHRLVHRLRDRFDAILIGVGTALVDDPSLTTRIAERVGRDPLRVVLDSRLRLPVDARMLQQSSDAATWIFCGPLASSTREAELTDAGAMVHRVGVNEQGRVDLEQVLVKLGRAGLTSVLVEGGAAVHGSFLRRDLVDEVCLFLAPFFIGDEGMPVISGFGIDSAGAAARLHDVQIERPGDDILVRGILHCPEDATARTQGACRQW